MRRTLLTITLLALAQAAFAQDTQAKKDTQADPEKAQASAEETAAPRHTIRVLQDPYDLASFYRSGGSAPEGWAGLSNDPGYAIAGFYRSQQGNAMRTRSRYGWSAFWTGGYGARRPAPLVSYRRTIGENGDLLLAVPFLAAVGPISGAFFGY